MNNKIMLQVLAVECIAFFTLRNQVRKYMLSKREFIKWLSKCSNSGAVCHANRKELLKPNTRATKSLSKESVYRLNETLNDSIQLVFTLEPSPQHDYHL